MALAALSFDSAIAADPWPETALPSTAAEPADATPAADQLRRLEAVTVTAQKRPESSQSVPIAISVLSQEELQQRGLRSAHEVLQATPNAGFAAAGGAKNNFFIRGVGTADFHLNSVGAVGVFVDDVALNSPFALSFALFDQQQVELLRGPQNTLFGRNTAGGAVHFLSRKPTADDGDNGFLRLRGGRFAQHDVEAAHGTRLGADAALRLALSSSTRDGVFDNRSSGAAAGEIQRHAGRAQLLLPVDERLSLLMRLHGGVDRGGAIPYKAAGLLDPDQRALPCSVERARLQPRLRPNCVDASGFDHRYQHWEDVFGNLPERQDIDAWGGALHVDWQWDGPRLTAITAIERFKVDYAEDADAAPTTVFHFFQHGDHDQLSQELRLSSADEQRQRWIAGLYFYREQADYISVVRRTPEPAAVSGSGRFNVLPNTIVEQRDQSFSLFAQLDQDWGERSTLTAGLRWTRESKRGSNAVSVRCVGRLGGPGFCPDLDDRVFLADRALLLSLPALVELPLERLDGLWQEWGGRLAWSHQLDQHQLFYASLTRGFKGGGFSVAALQGLLGNSAADVEPERLDAIEVGLKTEWPTQGLRLNLALFHYRWDGLQSFQPLLDATTGVAVPQLLNVPRSRLSGAEIELDWLFDPGWSTQWGLGLLRSRIDDPGAIAGVVAGNQLPNAPKLSLNGLLRRDIELGPGLLSLQAQWRYEAEKTNDLANAADLQLPSQSVFGARAGYRFGDNDRYELALWAENLNAKPRCLSLTSLAGLAESNSCLVGLSEPSAGLSFSVDYF